MVLFGFSASALVTSGQFRFQEVVSARDRAKAGIVAVSLQKVNM
jgi:hypothetical protein